MNNELSETEINVLLCLLKKNFLGDCVPKYEIVKIEDDLVHFRYKRLDNNELIESATKFCINTYTFTSNPINSHSKHRINKLNTDLSNELLTLKFKML